MRSSNAKLLWPALAIAAAVCYWQRSPQGSEPPKASTAVEQVAAPAAPNKPHVWIQIVQHDQAVLSEYERLQHASVDSNGNSQYDVAIDQAQHQLDADKTKMLAATRKWKNDIWSTGDDY